MNDLVLNRKMFRNKARHLEQMRTGQIPHALTGWGVGTGIGYGVKYGPRILPAAQKAWKSYRAARAVPNISRAQPAKEGWRQFWPFGKGAGGPKAASQVFRHKFPKTTAGITGALGADFMYEGGKNIYQGIRDKQYGKAVGGLGSMALGVPILGRASHLFSKAKKWKKGTEWAAKVGGKLRPKSWKDPKLWGPLAAIGGGAGYSMYTGEGEPDQLAIDEQNLIYNIARKIAIDAKANEITEEHWNEAVKIYGEKFAVREGQEGAVGDFDRGNPNEMNILNAELIPPSNQTPTNEDETAILEGQKLKDAETQAKVLKGEFNQADLATKDKFLKFRNQITELTGAQGNDRDLLLMKLASGMVSNKSGQKGLKGFLDVVGQSTGPVVDTAIALNQSQRQFDKDLAIAFLKAQEENKLDPSKVTGATQYMLVDDENALYKQKVVQVREDEQTGGWLQMNQDENGNITWVPLTGKNPRVLPVSVATQHKMRTKLSSAATGLQYVNYVLNAPDEILGWKGGVKLITEDWTGAMNYYQSSENKYTQGLDMGNFVETNLLSDDNLDTRKLRGIFGEKDMSHADWIRDEYRKDIEGARQEVMDTYNDKGLEQAQLDQLMQVALIETRLKYIIANANKHEDRLTKWDIEAAAERTGALGIIPRPFKNQNVTAKTIKSAYRALQQQLLGNFASDAALYQQSGGNNSFLESFVVIPYINQWKINKQAQAQSQAETTNILESIPVPGV